MAKVSLNVSVDDPDRFKSTLAEAKKLGLEVDTAYEELGVASGFAETTALPGLRRVHGLVLEADRSVGTMPVTSGKKR